MSVLAAAASAATLAPSTTAAFTPAAPTTTAAVLARDHGTSFVHHYGASHEVAAVACFNGVVRGGIIVDFDESKAAGLSSKPIAHYIHAIHGHTGLSKEIRYIGFSRRIREVPYK
jgi:hypothetical protein